MAPIAQEYVTAEKAAGLDGERVVISGMSGIFPMSNHVKDLSDVLYNKVNPVTDENCRWDFKHPEVSNYTGKVPGLQRFDAQFFKVHYRLGDTMDPMSRKMLEHAYQAIYDAGLNPTHLSGKKVGVYTGSCFSESEKVSFYVASSRSGFGIAGCNKSMFSNRISYWLNVKGPSMSVDDSCCSSVAALEQAYLAITRGECEAAIVGGANLCLHPQSSVHYSRIMQISADGKTKSFDQNANGCVKSDAVSVLFLQKAKTAKRVYAEILHIKNIFTSILEGDTGPKYGFYRDPIVMAEFMKQFYKEAKVSPDAVEYVEAFGSAVPEADKAELEAIEEVYCKNRSDPLFVGSVMSNIGYSEAASGTTAITKVLLGYHNGEIAANLHCDNPRQDINALRDGRMRIVTEHQSFGRTYTAVNGISVTGVNAHVLLHGNYKPKDINRYKSSIPYLVTISGRQEKAVQKIVEDLKIRDIDPEELALFHNIHQISISGHLGRGYVVLATNEEQKTVSLSEQVSYFDDAKRPLWFVYSGMGSQWAGMGAQLMRIPIFAAAIEKCRKVLEPKGVDIVHIITSPDKNIFDNILHCFVGIAAVQIGLTDILFALGLEPDMIIGHSVGELGCAYADGCFTAEEMILSAYSRGLVSVQTQFIRGSMAAVGIGYQQMVDVLPSEIEVACHNGPESCTISGPADVVSEFVKKLTSQSIFAKEVPCANIAYHSRYIAEAGPGLRRYLSEVIKNPKLRSKRWVSSSVPEERWDEPISKFSSAEYHTNNLLNPVLFEETCRHIPNNAVLVEIAPHGLMQAILKRSLPDTCHHIPLTRRGHSDSSLLLLDAIGKLYMEGYYPKVEVLYPKVEFPVSTGTPMLSHLVEWAHDENWSLPLCASARQKYSAACEYMISIHDADYSYLQGNVIRGKPLFPFSAALVAVWDTLAMTLGISKKRMSVEFHDVHLFAQPPLHDQRNLRLNVSIHRGTGYFEVGEKNMKVATGFINRNDKPKCMTPVETSQGCNNIWNLSSKDVYELMFERDYFYSGEFRSIYKANSDLTKAQIIWNKNWATFLDGILQLSALRQNHNTVSQPSHIRSICIHIDENIDDVTLPSSEVVAGNTVMTATVSSLYDYISCGGVTMENITFRELPKLNEPTIAMQSLKFVPRSQFNTDINTALQIYLQIVAENVNKESINVLKIIHHDSVEFNKIDMSSVDIRGVTVNYDQIQRDKVKELRNHFLRGVDLIFVENFSADDNLSRDLYRVLQRDTFILNLDCTNESNQSPLYRVLSVYKDTTTKLELIRWRHTPITADPVMVNVQVRSDLAVLKEKRAGLALKQNMVVVSSYPPVPGLKDLVKQWRRESDRNRIYLIMKSEQDKIDQLPELDLAFNVIDKGVWGGEYYIPLKEKVTVENNIALRIGQIGNLESLKWIEAPKPVGSGIPVTVHYVAINNKDFKRATGIISANDETDPETTFGMDFSGITDNGDRVMGILSSGAASRRVKARPELMWPVPAHWSLEDAVTVPSAYAHAFYCYAIKVSLTPGLSVLVHGGTGALGQAAIAIGLAHGCNIFTTVSDEHKKRFLMTLFPELREDHIGYSRDSSFKNMVMNETDGRGCILVFCCVKGDLKNSSLQCASLGGIVLDVVQLPEREKFSFGMYHLAAFKNYIPIDFTSIFANNNLNEIKSIQSMISEGIARGYVKPLSRVSYAPNEVSRAFRLVATSRHRGRAVIRMRESVEVIQSRVFCSPGFCHLLIFDGDIIGLKLAEKFITRGATKLHLHCSKISAHLQLKIKSWEKLGVEVILSSEDLSYTKNVLTLVNNSNRLGPVEGLYIFATSDLAKVDVISYLDLASRNLCPSLRYFAVISYGNSIGEEICRSRASNGLPGTMIRLSGFSTVGTFGSANTTRDFLSWRSTINAIELALLSSQAGVLAYPRKQTPLSLLQEILAIAEIRRSNGLTQSLTLQELGMETAKVPAICSYFQDHYNVSLPENQIPYMTIQQIEELEDIIFGTELKEVRGLETFFSYVDPDELMATTEIVFLPTLTIKRANMGDDEVDVSQTYMCIVPGMEGHYGRFRELCEKLKLPAVVLQPGFDHNRETPRETAERYVKILRKYSLTEKLYLVGYESGVIVALEMAAILEKNGYVGTVFCIGGSPEEVKSTIEGQLRDLNTDEALQDAVVKHMISLMVNNTEVIDQVLQKASTWQEQVDTAVRMLLGRVAHSAQYTRTLIESAYLRIKQVQCYVVEPQKLRSRIIFLHPRSSAETSINMPKEMLQKYSQHPVIVQDLHLPLAHATKDLRCPAILNKYLDEEILSAFDQKNLCDSYSTNTLTFIVRPDESP